MADRGAEYFRHRVHLHLAGKTLIDSGIRQNTGCSVIAVRRQGRMLINPDPTEPFQTDDEMIMIGTAESEKTFTAMYPEKG